MLKCINGLDNCDLTKSKKCIPCRFYQCIRAGMDPLQIQGARKKNILKINKKNVTKIETQESSTKKEDISTIAESINGLFSEQELYKMTFYNFGSYYY